jgi:hypothetical protein
MADQSAQEVKNKLEEQAKKKVRFMAVVTRQIVCPRCCFKVS